MRTTHARPSRRGTPAPRTVARPGPSSTKQGKAPHAAQHRTGAAPPPPPLLRNDRLAALPDLPYEVDLQAQGSGLPRGRGLDVGRLSPSLADLATTWIRSGRDGIAYHARRDGIVLAGASQTSRLARPRVQEPDLLAWADAVAEPQGLRFRLSDAGLRVEILTRLAGGRLALCHLIAGPMLPALRTCLDRRPTAEAFPDGDGLVLTGGHGLLRYSGIAARSAEPPVPDVPARTRGLTDELLTRRLLRRGLVLGCGLCQRPSFVAVDDVAQTNACSRCGAENELVQARWRHPADEPVWHYDLHPAVRELLAQHGDVPLLLSAWLRSRSAGYSDAAEIEMHPPGGAPVAEADLLAHADGRLIVAEAKSNDALGQNGRKTADAATKKARIAATLRADQLVLATRAAAWSAGSVDAARHALRHAEWPDGQPAALRLIAGLGGPHRDVADTRVDLDTGAAAPWSDR